MSRRFEISQRESWVGPILSAVKAAEPGDTIVVHSYAQRNFLQMELDESGKRGVRTVNTRRRNASVSPFDVRDPGENAAKLYNWIQLQAQAARQRI
jgi:hypothetical protein